MEAFRKHHSLEAPFLKSHRKTESVLPLLQASEKNNIAGDNITETSESTKSCYERRPPRRTTAPLLSSIATAVIMLFLWLLVEKHRALRQPQNYLYDAKLTDELQLDTVTCGDSVSEAMARGCTFDPLADMWLPQECSRAYATEYLGEFVDKHNNGTPWRYWADKERKHEIFNRSLYVDGTPYYSITKDHIIHCGLNLMRMADAIQTGARIGHMSPFEEHIKHCASELMRYALATAEEMSTGTQTGMGYC